MTRPLILAASLGILSLADTSAMAQQVTWATVTTAASPGNRAQFAYAETPAGGFLFGGVSTQPGFPSGDLWQFNGTNWILVLPTTAVTPPPRLDAAMVFDSVAGNLVLVGGSDGVTRLGDAWAFSLATMAWTPLAPLPAPRQNHAMCFDPVANNVVVFGGFAATNSVENSTLLLGAAGTWAASAAAGPGARFDGTMVYDTARSVGVLVGGRNNINDTVFGVAEWSGTAWTTIPASGPQARAGHAMTFDPVRARSVMFGGRFEVGSLPQVQFNDCWEWDGTNWVQDLITAQPLPREEGGLFFIAGQQRSIAFGGRSNAVFFGETHSRTSDFPAQFFSQTPSSCTGLSGLPILTATQLPWRNDNFIVSLTGVPDGAAATLFLDPFPFLTAPTPTPINLPFPPPSTCTLFTPGVLQFPNPIGTFTWTMPLSNDPVWIGFQMIVQAVALEPSGSFSTSGAMAVLVGDR